MDFTLIKPSHYNRLLGIVRANAERCDAAWYEKRLERLKLEAGSSYSPEDTRDIIDTEIMLEMVKQGLHKV